MRIESGAAKRLAVHYCLWPVLSRDIQHFIERLPVTNVIGHEQNQLAIEASAFIGTQAFVQVDQPGVEIIGIFDLRIRS